MLRFCFVFFLLIVAAAPLRAQEDATALLRQVAAAYKDAKSYHFESVTDSDLISELHRSWSRRRLILAKDAAGRVRFENIDSGGSHVVVSDGSAVWIAAPDTREFIRRELAGPLLEMKGGGPVAETGLRLLRFVMSSFQQLEENLLRAERLQDELLEVESRPVECIVVRADYSPPKGAVGIESLTRTFWIDKERMIVLREESVSRGKLFPSRPFDDVESRHRRRYLVASIDQPVAGSLFVYHPPPGFREMDSLERAFPRPARDLIGKEAPPLSLPALTGETLNLADLRGKIVLLDFWATWCEPCRKQMPRMAKLYRQIKDQGVVLLGVNDDEIPDEALKFTREHGYDWPSLYDGKQKEARKNYKVHAIPALVLIDSQGIVADYQLGAGDPADSSIRSALKKLGINLQ
jgi:peroxiredoxin/outer membrane lipoprotein-sorting protein